VQQPSTCSHRLFLITAHLQLFPTATRQDGAIVEAFNSWQKRRSIRKNHDNDLAGRLPALGLAYRQWAVTYPQRYQLIFGTPIANYHAPEEITLPAAARALVPLTSAIQDIYSAGRLRTERLAPMTPKLASMLRSWQEFEGGSDLEVLYLALVVWSRVHGLVALEIGNQLPAFLTIRRIIPT
jgi:hypothetical protein